jgi:hypothetical protein
MKRIISYFIAAAVLALPAVAVAQSTKTPPPGASGSAPGHQPGPSKDSAPGQKMLDEPGKPGGKGGASEYAPGQKDTTTTTKTPKK